MRAFSSSSAGGSTAAVPIEHFTLDRDIFNPTLYSRIQSLWFANIPHNATHADPEALKAWYGMGTESEKAAFDRQCHVCAGDALAAVGPQRLALAPFRSHDEEKLHAGMLSRPFLEEVKAAQARGEGQGADTLLALVLLLDQMPRNIFRTREELPMVYNHYDRLSLALLESARKLNPIPFEYEPYRHRPVVKSWYFMPLVHSESLAAHALFAELHRSMHERVASRGDEKAVAHLAAAMNAERQHLEPLRRFGRYPHRNECLQRRNTPEESEYLKTAHTFGVKQGGGKEEL